MTGPRHTSLSLTRVTWPGHTEPMSQPDPWATLARATGGVGLAGIVLLGPIIAMSSLGEPAFDATREEAAAFFRNTAESSWADAAGTVASWDSSR